MTNRNLLLTTLFSFCLTLTGCSATDENSATAAERKAGDRMVVKIKDVEYAFRWCPPGKFMMGSPAGEANRQDVQDNQRQHEVTLSHGFWMLETEVTQSMWESVMGNNPSRSKGAKLPVDTVSWNDCQGYITKLNALLADTPGLKFSLPTEAQWEYACRAGTTTAYHFGNSLSAEQANFNSGGTKEVGSYPANAWGLRDMHGNVWEWCQDWNGDYPSGAVIDPTGADMGSDRIIRGGSYFFPVEICRSASRSSHEPANGGPALGFRLALVSDR